jgi:serine/threonine protein kinase
VTVPESDSQLPKADDVIAGKYHVVRMLGEGGMGVVYEAVHKRLRQRVAIKMILPRLLKTTDFVARFEREARAASQIRGPNVARVIDVDVLPNGVPYMVMEYLEGHDLSAELRARGKLPIAEAVGFVLDACTAMHEAHAMGIIHRDLKPSNLFLCGEGGRRIVKVLDFGISKMTSDSDPSVTATETTIGTPLYMSPEQIRSAKRVDGRTDIWALGVILYELLANRTPFTGGPTAVAASIVADEPVPLRIYRNDAPEELEAVVMKALTKDMKGRHTDVAEFAAALRPFADGWAPLQSTDGAGGLRSSPTPSGPRGSERASGDAPTQLHVGLTPTERAATTPAAILRSQASTSDAAAVTPPPNSATASIPPPRSRKGLLLGVLIGVPAMGLAVYLAFPRGRADSGEHPTTAASGTTPSTQPVTTNSGTGTPTGDGTATVIANGTGSTTGTATSAGTGTATATVATTKPTAKTTLTPKPTASVTAKPTASATTKPTVVPPVTTATTEPTIPVHI